MKYFRHAGKGGRQRAFTLVELMVSVAVLVLLMAICFSILAQTSTVSKSATQKIDAFQGARLAFDLMTRQLAHATLNTYIDYDNPAAPQHYLRRSDLKFLIGPAGSPLGAGTLPGTADTGQCIFFAGPAGRANSSSYAAMDSLLNVCGYYVSFEDAAQSVMPPFIQNTLRGQQSHYRFCLMQLVVPTDQTGATGSLYPLPAPTTTAQWTSWQTGSHQYDWFSNFISGSSSSSSGPVLLAENIIALIIRPRDPSVSLTGATGQNPDLSSDNPNNPDYVYDSTENATTFPQPRTANQLPPVLEVTMIAIDEISALHLESGTNIPKAIASALGSRFKVAANFTSDLAAVEAALSSTAPGQPRIQYRVFSSTVPILEAKWTK